VFCTTDSLPSEAERIYADLTASFKRQHTKHAGIGLSEMSCLRVQLRNIIDLGHPKKQINLSVHTRADRQTLRNSSDVDDVGRLAVRKP
jgi:hypothetical protein